MTDIAVPPAPDAAAAPDPAAQPPAGAPGAPDPAPDAPDASAEILAALKELGVEPDADGKIDPADHVKLVSTLKTLREQVKSHEAAERKAQEQAEEERKKALPAQERALEEARQAGRDEALAEAKVQMVETLVTAVATASNFVDPADAKTMLDMSALSNESDVKRAIAKLAADKPYLVKAAPQGAKLEQGPRGTGKAGGGEDFLQAAFNKRRAG